MTHEIRDAVSKSIVLMRASLKYAKEPTADIVKAYCASISDMQNLTAEEIQQAAVWFLRESDGEFPSAPAFRRKVEEIHSQHWQNIGIELLNGRLFIAEVPSSLSPGARHEHAHRAALMAGHDPIPLQAALEDRIATPEEIADAQRKIAALPARMVPE